MQPRFKQIDVEALSFGLRKLEDNVIPDTLRAIAEGGRNLQSRYSWLRRDYQSLALLKYALGFPLQEVKQHLIDSAVAETQVLLRRGSMSDYSLSNSHANYIAVCHALIGGELSLATKLAKCIFDPPGSSYVAERSEVCNLNQQRLAYALRESFAQKQEEARRLLVNVRPRTKSERKLAEEASMLRSIIDASPGGFIAALESSLFYHAKEASKVERYEIWRWCIDRPAIAFCRLAIDAGLCRLADLPQTDPFLPIAFLDLS